MKNDKIIIIPDLSDHDLMNLPEIRCQIEKLTESIDSISLESLKWDNYDLLCVFLTGVLGGVADILIGKPGGYEEPEIKDISFFGRKIKLKPFDLKNNPIDKQIPGAFGGDHRLYSYGHDLLRILQGIRLILNGTGPVGINGSGGILELAQSPENYTAPDAVWKAIIVLALHLYKDFWTARSLPIPGSTLIAELNNNTMPEWLDKITNDKEFNLRMLSGQALSIGINELIPWLYLKIKYHNENIPNIMFVEKLTKMKLIGHTVSLLFNVGKVITTQNPLLLNYGQIIRILTLAVKAIVSEADMKNKAKIKVGLQVHKNKLELLETMLITEKALVYTYDANIYVVNGMLQLEDKIESSRSEREAGLALCKEKLNEFGIQAQSKED
jgi:hypothetical protein